MSIERLKKMIEDKRNPTVVGLDPRLSYIPAHILTRQESLHGKTLKAAAESVLAFNKGLIDALCEVIPAVKPQSAYYELLGWEGVRALSETIAYAKEKGLYTIADVKRNDIGTTAEAYAEAYLGYSDVFGEQIMPFDADSVTVNPYLGTDGIEPFVKQCARHGKSAFVLVKTSNPSSGELQNRLLEGAPLYERVAELVHKWGAECKTLSGFSQIGAVVGATWPAEQARLRELLPEVYFLVPGYGAQGATAEDIRAAFLPNGSGAIVNSSRAVLCAWQKTGKNGEDYQEAAHAEAVRMRDEVRRVVNL